MVLELTFSRKDKLVSQLVSSDDVKFYWSITAADFERDDEDVHDEVLRLLVNLFISLRLCIHKHLDLRNTNEGLKSQLSNQEE